MPSLLTPAQKNSHRLKLLKESAFYSFRPRPDQPDRNDQQTAFMNSQHGGLTVLLGGNGCLAGEQVIQDALTGEWRQIRDMAVPFHVLAWNGEKSVLALADAPHPCRLENLYEFILSDGQSFRATIAHRVLTRSGWQEIGDILRESNPSLFQSSRDDQSGQVGSNDDQSLTSQCPEVQPFDRSTICVRSEEASKKRRETRALLESLSSQIGEQFRRDSVQNVSLSSSRKYAGHSSRTPSDCRGDCSLDRHPCDERPQSPSNIARVLSRQPIDAREQSHETTPSDDQGHTRECSRICPCGDRLSMSHCEIRTHQNCGAGIVSSSPCSRSSDSVDTLFESCQSSTVATRQTPADRQSPEEYGRCCTIQSCGQMATASVSCQQEAFPSGEARYQSLSVPLQLTHDAASSDLDQFESNAPAIPLNRGSRQFELLSGQTDTIQSSSQSAMLNVGGEPLSSPEAGIETTRWIVSIRFLRRDTYYDFHVPQYENYLLAGVWHHNSGKSALAVKKAVNFMIKNDPPRPDTPFWMVSDTFESTMTTVWVEKLYDKGHLPKQCVDWERIRWYKPNSNWPYEVPLKKTKKSGYRNNWSIVMKSFDMGRRKFQGQSIGGFMFTEQFEHALLVESMRGCREKAFEHFKGNKICEFTPIDPHLSLWLQEMEENGEVPDDWGIYRSNTECAAEAGNVSMDWYQNQFLPMIPQSMIPARTQGLWSGYEGLIYPSFNPEVHCIFGDWTPPPGWHHRRMIDWGAGSHNAFVCLFGCFNPQGEWVIYDEYYSNDTMLDTIDHLKRISDQHHWPKSNPYYGITWADPTSADRMRIASKLSDHAPGYDSLNVQAAFNRVLEGIECVSSMLKMQPSIGAGIPGRPKVRIVKDNCPNLVRELRMYQWMDQSAGGINPTSARMEPKKINDHACTVASMLVLAKSGWVPISQVRSGDYVNSGHDWTKVITGATKTGENRELVKLVMDNGDSIVCTPCHELLTGVGWVPASSIRGMRCLRYLPCGGGQLVVSVQSCGTEDVYCIATESGSMVWDGGYVVSNCDALRYGLASEMANAGITPSTIARQHSANRHGIQLSSTKFDRR